MSNITKKAIIRALLEGVLTDLMVKTTGDQVYLDSVTTLSAKLTEMITVLNNKASSDALVTGLEGKADASHSHAQSEVTGLTAALADKASSSELNTAIANLRAELMGEGVPEAYDTFKELSDYIDAHTDVADALNAAVGNKADKSVVDAIKAVTDALGSLANKDNITESDLDAALREKVNAASEGNHSHANKGVLDSISEETVAYWNGKSRVLVSSSQPSDLAAGDLWIQTV